MLNATAPFARFLFVFCNFIESPLLKDIVYFTQIKYSVIDRHNNTCIPFIFCIELTQSLQLKSPVRLNTVKMTCEAETYDQITAGRMLFHSEDLASI